jgi:ubiquinol oxidase
MRARTQVFQQLHRKPVLFASATPFLARRTNVESSFESAASGLEVRHFRRAVRRHNYPPVDLVVPRGEFDPGVADSALQIDASAAAAADGAEWTHQDHCSVWTSHELNSVQCTHFAPRSARDIVALAGAKFTLLWLRLMAGVSAAPTSAITQTAFLRMVMLHAMATAIPGLLAGHMRHLESLRHIRRDHGWIPNLLEQAENERMHSIVFRKWYKPARSFKAAMVASQVIFWNTHFWFYLLAPRLSHRFVAYLEEYAVKFYTDALEQMTAAGGTAPTQDQLSGSDVPDLRKFGKSAADPIAIHYWKLHPSATNADVLRSVRADAAYHRDMNHTYAELKSDERSPFPEERPGPNASQAETLNK